ncbi:MAG: LCP family protein [Acidimicrobiales bacterium]|nr:LCP family protein [Acidimicrobiales bacterium]
MARDRGRRAGGGRLRRTWPQRLLIAFNATALVAALATAGVIAYGNDRVSRVTRHVFTEGVLATDEVEPGDPLNYLIVGVDDASGLAEDDVVRRRPSGVRLTDTIMVLRVDPRSAAAEVLSFPRDLYVPIPDHGRSRINRAFEVGGPELLVRTIDENFGIPIHHYLQVDFAGFRELVSLVGGIPVWFPHPTRSRSTVELSIPEAGCWVLGPRQALGFARVRKDYQVQDADGRWHRDPGEDFSRQGRQQLFIQLALRQAINKGARNLNTLRRLLDVGVLSVSYDEGLELQSVVDLSRSFRSFDPADLVTYTLPVDDAPRGGPAYLYLREEEAEPILARFRQVAAVDPSAPPATVDPGDVVVQVRNGTGTANQATEVTAELAARGFATVVPGADTGTGLPTVVQYRPGGVDAARTVGAQLADSPLYQEVTDLPSGVDVMIRTGLGWPGLAEVPRTPDEVPTTTTDPATATTGAGAGDPDAEATPGDEATPGPTTTVPDEAVAGDPDDPSDPAFYRASAPPPGATCRPTE